MIFGGHVSSSGGLEKSIDRAVEITAECIQIFVSAPQMWRTAKHSDESVSRFIERRDAARIGPILLHGPYLINLASNDPALRTRSADAIISQLEWSDRLGGMGVVFHVGSSVKDPKADGMTRAVEGLADVLSRSKATSPLVLETTAGGGNTLGVTFEELGELIDRLDKSPRLHVCLDTCHIFSAGYPFLLAAELDETLAQFDRAVGLDRLTCVHLNDSKFPMGSHRDRHHNIGDGTIGLEGFRTVVNHAAMRNLPGFLEVPGLNDEGPDAENLRRLRDLVAYV